MQDGYISKFAQIVVLPTPPLPLVTTIFLANSITSNTIIDEQAIKTKAKLNSFSRFLSKFKENVY